MQNYAAAQSIIHFRYLNVVSVFLHVPFWLMSMILLSILLCMDFSHWKRLKKKFVKIVKKNLIKFIMKWQFFWGKSYWSGLLSRIWWWYCRNCWRIFFFIKMTTFWLNDFCNFIQAILMSVKELLARLLLGW